MSTFSRTRALSVRFIAALLALLTISVAAHADVIGVFTLTEELDPSDGPTGPFMLDLTTQSVFIGVVPNGSLALLDFPASLALYTGTFLLAPATLEFSGCPGGFNTCASFGTYSGGGDLSVNPVNPLVAAAYAASGVITPQPVEIGGTYDFSTFCEGTCSSVPTPEPTTLVLFGIGLVGIGLSRRRLAR